MPYILKKIRLWRVPLVLATVIAHFFVSPLIFWASANTANVSFELAVLAPTPTAETPPPTTTAVPGLAFPGLVVTPNTQEVIFVPGEDGISPYVVVLMLSGHEVKQGEIVMTYSREPEFLGKTNLRNSVIYLQYDHAPERVFTTFSDLQGKWAFLSPEHLGVGWHTLYVTAMSTINPYFQAYTAFQFYVAPIPEIVPTPPLPPPETTPTPPPPPVERVTPLFPLTPVFPRPTAGKVVPPAPGKEIPLQTPPEPRRGGVKEIPSANTATGEKQGFGLFVEVSPESRMITPGKPVSLRGKVVPLPPPGIFDRKKEVVIRLRVYDAQGRVVYEKTETRPYESEITIEKLLQTTNFITPGKYFVSLEVEEGKRTFVSTSRFTVEDRVLSPSQALFEKIQGSKDILVRGSMAFSFLGIFFLLYLLREYRLSRSVHRVRDEKLKDGGFIK